MKIDIKPDEAEAIRAALETLTPTCTVSIARKPNFRRLEDLFRKLAGSERR
jgi:hypothetical protein